MLRKQNKHVEAARAHMSRDQSRRVAQRRQSGEFTVVYAFGRRKFKP